jgi:hypothetical protein
VFLSYASEDREAARLLRDALSAGGLDVWYDESELGGGEAWDQKIRRQIRECDYFMPLVSAQTEARHEGYFRREWRLAVERTLDMADDHPFLLPIVIDDTDQAVARVPEKFLAVQWLKVPGGRPSRALESLCRRIAGNAEGSERTPNSAPGKKSAKAAAPQQPNPPFPREEPGQKTRFWVEVMGWAVRSVWIQFQRLPRWVRLGSYAWLAVTIFSNTHSRSHKESSEVTPEKLEKLKAIAQNTQGASGTNDGAKLGAAIAKEFASASDELAGKGNPLLAISHHGQVQLAKEPLPSHALSAAVQRAKANHCTYVLHGSVEPIDGVDVLTVKILTVADGSVEWSKAYPAAGADPTKIAADIDANIPQGDAEE